MKNPTIGFKDGVGVILAVGDTGEVRVKADREGCGWWCAWVVDGEVGGPKLSFC